MIRETERLYDAIDALCGKRKAKKLKRLARRAIQAEREQARPPRPYYYPWWGIVPPYAWPYSEITCVDSVSSTTISVDPTVTVATDTVVSSFPNGTDVTWTIS